MKKSLLKDHREIGRELDLFFFDEISPGSVFWLPKGMVIFKELEKFIRLAIDSRGYQEISTPIIAKTKLFKKSGHWQFFKENMFNFKVEGQDYSIKPMNCPESTIVFSSKTRSYRDLPLRFSELGRLHRNERSGTLNGLFRVRQFTIDDAHLFVRPDQIQEEIGKLLTLVIDVYKSLDFYPKFYLATRPKKAMGDIKDWNKAEKDLKTALENAKVNFGMKPKEGAFYGPKIDIHIKDSQNRDWQLATIQLDFQIPKRMDCYYVDHDHQKKQPVMIHRGIFGSLERFIGIITEHFQGAFPVWLSPIQVIVLPLSDKFIDYAQKVSADLKSYNIRTEVDERNETLQAKIRDATLQKIPYILVVGAKEKEAGTVSVRTRDEKDAGQVNLEEFIEKIKSDIANRK